MRRGRNGSFWLDDSGRVIAANLGADYCAEHEFGIKGIRRSLGMPEKAPSVSSSRIDRVLSFLKLNPKPKVGIADKQMTGLNGVKVVHNLDTKGLKVKSGWGKEKKTHTMWGFAMLREWMADSFDLKNLDQYYSPTQEQLIGHWAEDNFGLISEEKEHVKDLVQAFEKNDIAVWVGAGGPFQNGGLIVAIVSRIPQDFLDEMTANDEDQIKLTRAAIDTGIYEKLDKAEKKYFALSPGWDSDAPGKVIFWLNPYDQENNNSGWYTVEDLEDWIKGKGKVSKVKEEV